MEKPKLYLLSRRGSIIGQQLENYSLAHDGTYPSDLPELIRSGKFSVYINPFSGKPAQALLPSDPGVPGDFVYIPGSANELEQPIGYLLVYYGGHESGVESGNDPMIRKFEKSFHGAEQIDWPLAYATQASGIDVR